MKSRSRTPSKLDRFISQRLDAYAAAAASAVTGDIRASHTHWPYLLGGLGMVSLGLGVPCEAKIVYTPANHVIHSGSHSHQNRVTYPVDLNHDGKNDVVFSQFCGVFDARTKGCYLRVYGASNNGIEVGTKGYGWARAMKIGAHIGHAKPFSPRALMACKWVYSSDHGTSGYWFNSEPRYLGVAFKITGKTHYGWLRLKNSSDREATLTGYAYETIPGRSIKAGYKKSTHDAGVDELHALVNSPLSSCRTLGALALGSVGKGN